MMFAEYQVWGCYSLQLGFPSYGFGFIYSYHLSLQAAKTSSISQRRDPTFLLIKFIY